jgi:hypothetical protein
MITPYEMKNTGVCKCIYRLPYYVKNLILLMLLGVILLLNYLINFRKDTAFITSVTKVLAGLNSHTFNYLADHEQTLFITDKIKKVSVTRTN